MNINTIATSASQLSKRVSKKEAFAIIKELVDRPINEYDISRLYSYFMPPVPAKPKTAEQWVAKAMAKADVRYYLNYLYSDGKRLLATDGHRLHAMPTDLEAGFYNTDLVKVDVDARYPDTNRVIPDVSCWAISRFVLAEAEAVDVQDWGLAVEVAPNTWIRRQYMVDAMRGESEVNVYYRDKRTAVRIDYDDGGMAVLMPIRVSK